jgi:hypothetical protein
MIVQPLTVALGVFVLVCAISGCEPPKKTSSARLQLQVHQVGGDFDFTNHDAFDWRKCILRANVMSVKYRGFRFDSDLDIPAGGTVRVDGLKFHAGINGGGEPLNPTAVLNMGATCDTPAGQATGAAVRF